MVHGVKLNYQQTQTGGRARRSSGRTFLSCFVSPDWPLAFEDAPWTHSSYIVIHKLISGQC